MLSRSASTGTPGGGWSRTRRSTRAAAAAAAAAASPAPLLEPAGPLGPAAGPDAPATTSAGGADGTDDSAALQGVDKRPRNATVGLFSDASLDDVASTEATAATSAAFSTADPPVTEQTPSSASGGGQANDSCATSPPGPGGSGTSSTAQATSAAGAADQAAAEDRPDCAICLEACLHPVKLPCGHIFCFLCVKGAAKQSARCAYCRAEVTEKYINNPRLLDEAEVEREMTDTSQSYHWLYQGRNGWWRYDERTTRDIEAAFAAQQTSVQISVAGELYTVDFSTLTQFNDQCRGRRRRVRREATDATPDPTLRCKGVAGLRKRRRRQ